MVAEPQQHEIGFTSLHAINTTTPGGQLVFYVFVALVEFIRELIVAGTREGLAAARTRDRVGGPPAVVNDDLLRAARDTLPNPEHSIISMAKLLGVNRRRRSIATFPIFTNYAPRSPELLRRLDGQGVTVSTFRLGNAERHARENMSQISSRLLLRTKNAGNKLARVGIQMAGEGRTAVHGFTHLMALVRRNWGLAGGRTGEALCSFQPQGRVPDAELSTRVFSHTAVDLNA